MPGTRTVRSVSRTDVYVPEHQYILRPSEQSKSMRRTWTMTMKQQLSLLLISLFVSLCVSRIQGASFPCVQQKETHGIVCVCNRYGVYIDCSTVYIIVVYATWLCSSFQSSLGEIREFTQSRICCSLRVQPRSLFSLHVIVLLLLRSLMF